LYKYNFFLKVTNLTEQKYKTNETFMIGFKHIMK